MYVPVPFAVEGVVVVIKGVGVERGLGAVPSMVKAMYTVAPLVDEVIP
jgi:hypothetical protein